MMIGRFRIHRTSRIGRCRSSCRFLRNRRRAVSATADSIGVLVSARFRYAGRRRRARHSAFRCGRLFGARLGQWRLAITHEGGHTPFWADITNLLDKSAKQTVTVYVEDDPHDLSKPRGKQDWQLEPHSIWYPRTTGIWQTVWLERLARTYVEKIRWTPHMSRMRCSSKRVTGDPADDLAVEVVLCHGERCSRRIDTWWSIAKSIG